jgi:hypothetical protein
LVLEPALDIYFSLDFTVFLFVFSAKLDHFDTIDVAINTISDLEYFSAAALSK